MLVEQHKFLCEIQNENQTGAEFVAVLQKRSIDCAFVCECRKSVANIFLRVQFIRGLGDSYIREQLLQKPESTFMKITQKAVKTDNRTISNSASVLTADVHQVRQQQEREHDSQWKLSSRSKSRKDTSLT